MPPTTQLSSPDLYTVGWISALAIERAAAIAMLDERHTKPAGFVQHESDKNSYSWGRINEHNIVIASLASGVYGTTSAAVTTAGLLSSLPQIRIGLLVGIGGAISRPDQGYDVRLGDVVVSKPSGTHGGVVQYDIGKATAGGWDRKDCLGLPPQVLLNAVTHIEAEHIVDDSRISEFLQGLPPKMTQTTDGYVYQGSENDRLFKSSSYHQPGDDCSICDPTELVTRKKRPDDEPQVHYGTIGSGNILVKDAQRRDQILVDVAKDIICLEMEAAGLMMNFPCLVIRGISDYADAHKNDRWQKYASATAACYAKELLGYVPSTELQVTLTAAEAMKSISQDIRALQKGIQNLQTENDMTSLRSWLSPIDVSTDLQHALRKRHDGTGSWFLESEVLERWKSGTRRHLWLNGIPGSGKTILSSIIVDNISQTLPYPLLYFFCNGNDASKQSMDKIIRSLVFQLYAQSANCQKELDLLLETVTKHQQPSLKALFKTFQAMIKNVKRCFIIIDALDECVERVELLDKFQILAQNDFLQFIFTSRREADIDSVLSPWIYVDDVVRLDEEKSNVDIRTFIHEQLQRDSFTRWDPSVRQEIESELLEKTNGMFMWVVCQLDILKDCLDLRTLREKLRSLPRTLHGTYAQALLTIKDAHRNHAIKLLQVLADSDVPLTGEQAFSLLSLKMSAQDTGIDFTKLNESNPRKLLNFCPSLLSIVQRAVTDWDTSPSFEVRLSHFTVQQYLKSPQIEKTFPANKIDVGLVFRDAFTDLERKRFITKVCLEVLSPDPEGDAWESSSDLGDEHPLLAYSISNFMKCAKFAETNELMYKDIEKILYCAREETLYALEEKDAAFGCSFRGADGEVTKKYHPLAIASRGGLVVVAKGLLKDLSELDKESRRMILYSSLSFACVNGHESIVELLIKDFQAVEDFQAVVKSKLGRLFTRKNYNWDRYGEPLGQYPGDCTIYCDSYSSINDLLFYASSFGRAGIVKILIRHGASVNKPNRDGLFAVQCASTNGHDDVLEILLKNGAVMSKTSKSKSTPLHMAANVRSTSCLKLLLRYGADVDARDHFSRNLCHGTDMEHLSEYMCRDDDDDDDGGEFSKSKHIPTMKIASLANKILKDSLRQPVFEFLGNEISPRPSATSLFHVAHRSNPEAMELLLKAGADPNARASDGASPLFAAVISNRKEAIKLLLKFGADPNLIANDGWTAISSISHWNFASPETIILLLKAGADPHLGMGKQQNLLALACLNDSVEAVRLLLEKGGWKEEHRQATFLSALYATNQEILPLVYDKCVQSNQSSLDLNAALIFAIRNAPIHAFQFLLDLGAWDDMFRDALLKSASYTSDAEIQKIVLQKCGASEKDLFGVKYAPYLVDPRPVGLARSEISESEFADPIFEDALLFGNRQLAMSLLHQGRSIKSPSDYPGTMLCAAALGGIINIVSGLLDIGVDMNAKGLVFGCTCTPLVAAAWGRHNENLGRDREEIVRLLVERNANIEATGCPQNGISGTPLFVAAIRGNEKIVQLLLDFGAQADTKGAAYDPEGYEISATAYQYCYHFGKMEIADLLRYPGVGNGS